MRNVRFLIVDDSAMARSLVASVIRTRLGATRITEAGDGKQAILRLQEAPVDIIISDWAMGQVNGDELLAYVRRTERLKHLPFIMVSTHNEREFIVNALQLGVNHYLVKPFTPAELEQRIRGCWNSANQRGNERHADLPQHRMVLKVGSHTFAGELMNLSRSGSLLRVKHGNELGLFKRCELSLLFSDPASSRQWSIPRLNGTTVRLEAEHGEMCMVALKFDTDGLPAEEVATPFDELIAWLAAREPQVITG